ncbi:UxaA family hydrolase [Chloroflexi bacterium TSY]|nr:UxaA family hydrolase [Chloroflexi bacterium TSY]
MVHPPISFSSVGRLPLSGDNVAIATRILPAGTFINLNELTFTLDFTVLVGHRFAIKPIAQNEALLSWGVPFGIATEPIMPGQYVCNEGMLEALNGRSLDFHLPPRPNFRDRIVPHQVNEAFFQPGKQVERSGSERTFMGYRRSRARGVGTRNMIVILGTTSSTASYARTLAERLQPATRGFSNLDGIVPIAHTEGSGYERINNRDFLLRTLAGLIVHPNVAAVLAVDLETDNINNRVLKQYMEDNEYPLNDVVHHFYTPSGNWDDDLARGANIVEAWLPKINDLRRTPESIARLSIALQCGGSDAFSGISGNPLASNVAKEIIRSGGRANLAETDELIGSEAYVLQNVRDLGTAQTFLNYIAEFKERLSWHGQSAEGNPSGGNKYRGLYNIALKSIGAAMKKHPDVRLDYVVDYGERMMEPGYFFMNTPGNDLESIAGQVAGGSNLIIFVTGNGSITNFPFVPTIKVMTTTQRYELLSQEMDVNAGAYLDGTSMEQLTQETVDLLIDIASGQPSKGERAGHSQISIWRNWQQQDRSRLPLILERMKPDGCPIQIGILDSDAGQWEMSDTEDSLATLNRPQRNHAKIGLILPTSLCSGQIARLAAARLNEMDRGEQPALSRFATLVHTEGCGVAFASTREIYAKTMIGYATHPLVGACLFLEHGCEKAHNDYLHSLLDEAGLSAESFGWASVQLDGGIEKVTEKISTYFCAEHIVKSSRDTSSRALSVALFVEPDLTERDPAMEHWVEEFAISMAEVTQLVVGAGGTVVIPDNGALVDSPRFLKALSLTQKPLPTLAYGQSVQEPGFHLMEMPTNHWTETLTGLGATGVDALVGCTDKPRTGHPFVPVLLVGNRQSQNEIDLVLEGNSADWAGKILRLISAIVSGQGEPISLAQNNTDFQLTRGWLGIST